MQKRYAAAIKQQAEARRGYDDEGDGGEQEEDEDGTGHGSVVRESQEWVESRSGWMYNRPREALGCRSDLDAGVDRAGGGPLLGILAMTSANLARMSGMSMSCGQSALHSPQARQAEGSSASVMAPNV